MIQVFPSSIDTSTRTMPRPPPLQAKPLTSTRERADMHESVLVLVLRLGSSPYIDDFWGFFRYWQFEVGGAGWRTAIWAGGNCACGAQCSVHGLQVVELRDTARLRADDGRLHRQLVHRRDLLLGRVSRAEEQKLTPIRSVWHHVNALQLLHTGAPHHPSETTAEAMVALSPAWQSSNQGRKQASNQSTDRSTNQASKQRWIDGWMDGWIDG